MRISDWSSDVCSSDLAGGLAVGKDDQLALGAGAVAMHEEAPVWIVINLAAARIAKAIAVNLVRAVGVVQFTVEQRLAVVGPGHAAVAIVEGQGGHVAARSEERRVGKECVSTCR